VFKGDSTKIVWAMSYMKSGCANRWATCEFEQEVKAGRLRFLDWDDFEDEFRKDFMPLDAVLMRKRFLLGFTRIDVLRAIPVVRWECSQ